jgi:O-succinylbenzoate synthase
MYIDAIETYYVVLPLREPFRTAYGEDVALHAVLVRMQSGEVEGWGEVVPLYAPTYSPETATSAYFLITELFAPLLVGCQLETAEDLLARLSPFKGNPLAKAGVESAWWVLRSIMAEQPLHRLLGGEHRPVEAGADIGIQDSYDMLLQTIQRAVDRGFGRVKLKVRPGWDLEMLQIVRSAFPNLRMHIDCNAGYSLADLPFFKAVDALDLAMIEQPLFHTDLFDHAALQRQLDTPICLDESITSGRTFELALRLGSCRILNIKYGRVGGLSVALKLHDMAREAGMPCWVGGMLESGLGVGINVELATLPNFTYPGDLFESSRFSQPDLTEPQVQVDDNGTLTPSARPGTAFKPVPERVEQAARQRKLVRSTQD